MIYLYLLLIMLSCFCCVAKVGMSSQLKRTFTNKAVFGAGCYWGTEKFFKYDFNKKYPGGMFYNLCIYLIIYIQVLCIYKKI